MVKTFKKFIDNQFRSYSLLQEVARKTDEIYWSTIFNSAIADSSWFKTKSLNPGRWAAGYPMLYILYRVYNEIKPKSIIEFGLGETSKLSYQYKESVSDAQLTIVEQDINWLNFFSSNIHNVVPNTVVLDIVTKNVHGYETKVYKGLNENIGSQKFDFIIVDGPYGSEHYSRYQVVEMVENNLLEDDFIIIIDDYNRLGEQETANKLRHTLNAKKVEFVEGVYSGAKQTLLLCSKKYNFLTSL